MDLNCSLFIEKRTAEKRHLSLDGIWQYSIGETKCDHPETLNYVSDMELPDSVAAGLYNNGTIEDPYVGTNSRQVRFISDKVWYFRKIFPVEKACSKEFAYLCFEGLAYYAKIWLNGELLGEHEGMLGGPVIEVSSCLNYGGENELIVETTACNYGHTDEPFDMKDDTFCQPSWLANKSVIAPWLLVNDTLTSHGDFNIVGIWRGVRLEFLEKYHICNPYLYTAKITKSFATLKLEVPISNPFMDEAAGLVNKYYVLERSPLDVSRYMMTDCFVNEQLQIRVEILDSTDVLVADFTDDIRAYDLTMFRAEINMIDHYFYRKEIKIRNPEIWCPNGLGGQPLYTVKLTLMRNGKICDEYEFRTGIRTVTAIESAGDKFHTRWGKFQFVVNGKKIFVKGMNMAPFDQLLHFDEKKCKWLVWLMKKQGIQMVRVWNGGGVPESDMFYELCDRYGIMVWQDALIANATTKNWDPDIVRSQMVFNLMRLRNHPSLVLICGGNEFNPYTKYNAATMYAIQSETEVLVPDRIFFRSTSDGGDLHVYLDMEPTWYRHMYKQLPFMGESGIHSFPTYKTLQQILSPQELNKTLNDLFTWEFEKEFPDLRNHFSEFDPVRILRMMARTTHIRNIKDIYIKDIAEASQVASYEFYLIMIESLLENYPITVGVLPWVFNRPWPTTAVQLVDGRGNPTAQYYAVKRAYEAYHPFIALEHLSLRPGEAISLPIKLFSTKKQEKPIELRLEVYDTGLQQVLSQTFVVKTRYMQSINAGIVTYTPQRVEEGYVIIRLGAFCDGELVGESLYYPKYINALNDNDFFERMRREPLENMFFENGPFLYDTVLGSGRGAINVQKKGTWMEEGMKVMRIEIENISDIPIYPVVVDSEDVETRIVSSDNYFFLAGREKRSVNIYYCADTPQVFGIEAWNANLVKIAD